MLLICYCKYLQTISNKAKAISHLSTFGFYKGTGWKIKKPKKVKSFAE
jgi:hypothetical protein